MSDKIIKQRNAAMEELYITLMQRLGNTNQKQAKHFLGGLFPSLDMIQYLHKQDPEIEQYVLFNSTGNLLEISLYELTPSTCQITLGFDYNKASPLEQIKLARRLNELTSQLIYNSGQ